METVGVWDWFWLILLFVIPVINIIAFIVIACGYGNRNVVNLCRAYLIWAAIGLGLYMLFAVLAGI